MSTTYSWDIAQLECYPEHEGRTNVVFMIHWRRQAINGAHCVNAYGSQGVSFEPTEPFTSFADLTKKQVEEWLIKELGPDQITSIDAGLDKQIYDTTSPPVINPPLPW